MIVDWRMNRCCQRWVWGRVIDRHRWWRFRLRASCPPPTLFVHWCVSNGRRSVNETNCSLSPLMVSFYSFLFDLTFSKTCLTVGNFCLKNEVYVCIIKTDFNPILANWSKIGFWDPLFGKKMFRFSSYFLFEECVTFWWYAFVKYF